MGYNLCKMFDFQNVLISRIFGVFSSGFFLQNEENKSRSRHNVEGSFL